VAAAFRVTAYLLASILLVGLGEASSGAAPTSQEATQAREHFKSAQVHYDLKEYSAALEEFKSSYRLVQDPVMLFNIAQCHYFLGQNEEALGFYRNFLRRSPDAPNRATVERKIQDLERKVAAAGKTAPAPAPAAAAVPRPAPVTPSLTPPPAPPPGAIGSGTAVSPSVLAPVAATSLPTAPPNLDQSAMGQPPVVDLSTPSSSPAVVPTAPVWKRWWFWTGVGAIVAVGVVAGVAIAGRGEVGDCRDNQVCLKVGGK
jgi:hypothetical protein